MLKFEIKLEVQFYKIEYKITNESKKCKTTNIISKNRNTKIVNSQFFG